MERMTWEQICQRLDCRGRWIALDACDYDKSTGKATGGSIVDTDEDLAELCGRLQEHQRKNCAIVFCSADSDCSHGPN